ncbi:hypothetical protein [Parendozoicomonas sp. Alg238-R29]|uniref:hypothetical protein n=1 Tax=Parendozoicomonas sp. Alg238-R29 TaxID=2993446 RepID=UPI00248DC94E|nr:hypothetical protein [Parendozoicomonas sp. Alg238-R29]
MISRIWQDDILLLEGWGLTTVFKASVESTQILSIPIFENNMDNFRLAGRIETRMRRCGQGVAYLLKENGRLYGDGILMNAGAG